MQPFLPGHKVQKGYGRGLSVAPGDGDPGRSGQPEGQFHLSQDLRSPFCCHLQNFKATRYAWADYYEREPAEQLHRMSAPVNSDGWMQARKIHHRILTLRLLADLDRTPHLSKQVGR